MPVCIWEHIEEEVEQTILCIAHEDLRDPEWTPSIKFLQNNMVV